MTSPTGISLGGDNPNKILLVDLTFGDVLLPPDVSDVIPFGVDTSTQLTRELRLNVPIVSAVMDTITETHVAVAMACQGDMSALHRNLSIEEQAQQVEIMKRSGAGMVSSPVTCSPGNTTAEVDTKCARYRISGLPVVDKDGKLVDVCTSRDMRFEADLNRKVSEIMMPMPLVAAEQGVSGGTTLNLSCAHKVEKLPVIDDEDRLTSLATVRDSVKEDQYSNVSEDGSGRLLVDAGIDTGKDSWKRVRALADTGVDVLVVDTVHVHSSGVLEIVSRAKKEFSENIQVIDGDLATRGAAQVMIDVGADAIKVGIGPGSVCTTCVVTSVGTPQITAIMEASVTAKKTGVPIIADGGMQFSGDITRALAAGTSSVMLGSMLAGAAEAPGEVTFVNGKQCKMYRGMGSLGATRDRGLTGEERSYSKDRYFQADVKNEERLVPEGIESRVSFRGSIDSIIHQLVGGLCVVMDYTGSTTVKQLHGARFVQITAASLRELHPRDIQMTVEASSYCQR